MAWFKCVGPVEGGSSIVEKRYARFTSNYGLRLPDKFGFNTDAWWGSSDNNALKIELKIFSTLQRSSSKMYYFLNNRSYDYSCLYEYNGSYYGGSSNNGYSKWVGDWSFGEHIYIENDDNGDLNFDGYTRTYNGQSGNYWRCIGPSGGPSNAYTPSDIEDQRINVCLGWIMYLKIYNKLDNNRLVCHIVPAEVDGVPHLYDKVSGKLYSVPELYVTDTTPSNKVSYRVYSTDISANSKIRITKYYDDAPAESQEISSSDCSSSALTIFDDISVDFGITYSDNWNITSLCDYLKYNNVNYGTNEEVTHFAYNVDTDFMLEKVSS